MSFVDSTQRRWAGKSFRGEIYIEIMTAKQIVFTSVSFTGNHTGLYNARQQQFIYPPVYSSIELAESSAIVFSGHQNGAQLSGTAGDAYGNVIIAPQFSSTTDDKLATRCVCRGKRMNDKILYGLFDFSGNIIIPFATILSLIQIIGTISNFIAVAKTGAGGDR